jgi:hypothetical protein
VGAIVGADGRIVQGLNHNIEHQGPITGPRHSHPTTHAMNTTVALREHVYSFQPTSDPARVRVAIEHIPTAHVAIQYLLTPDATRLAFALIRSGATDAVTTV